MRDDFNRRRHGDIAAGVVVLGVRVDHARDRLVGQGLYLVEQRLAPAGVLGINQRDAGGLTGRDAIAAPGFTRAWKESREPLTLETSVPGVFAAGDVRANAMNRVASAVGEGSMVTAAATAGAPTIPTPTSISRSALRS